MLRFVFRLDPLLTARRRAEETVQREVAALQRQRLDMEDRIRRRQHAIRQGKQDLRDELTGTLRMSDLRGHAGTTLRLMRDAQKLVLELAGLHKRLDAARGRLLEAVRRRRAIEILRERRREQWRAAAEKADTDAMDELAVIAAARREAES